MGVLTVVITGANRGIGLELTRSYLNSQNWKVIACSRSLDRTAELKALQIDFPGRLLIQELDVSSDNSVQAFKHYLGLEKIDLLINNAGNLGGDQQSLENMDFDRWAETLNVNVLGPLRMVQALMHNLKLSDVPKIVTLSSQMGSMNILGEKAIAYRSSKAAVNKVMQTAAIELNKFGITTVVVHPGWVQTDMGGPSADITPTDSARGLFKVISSLRASDTGKFFNWNGEIHPW